jgi:hypothetical protein
MPIAFVNLGNSVGPTSAVNPDINTATNATSYANSSWTPPTTGIILLAITCSRNSGGADACTVSGNGLTWTQFGDNVVTAGGEKLLFFAALAAGATTGATTISWGSNTQLHCTAEFCQVTGVDVSGGLDAAIVQIVSSTGTGTTGTVNLAAASHADNRPFVAFHRSLNETATPRTNWTELDDLNGVGGTRSLQTQCR